jgi:3-deoxy-D-manno-octulosonate 8-phosphate phosphatase (KDO 8-P phosphatase)
MESLNVDLIYQGHHDKIPVYEEMKSMFHLKNEEIAYMGDDITDLPLIRRSGLGVAPSNAHNFVKQHANYVTEKSGGHGAVRELCDLILSSKGLFDKIYSQYL